ncbi:hypothetical protein Tco_0249925 [Tanacetum coccineum]
MRKYLRKEYLELSYTDTMDFLFSPFLRTRMSASLRSFRHIILISCQSLCTLILPPVDSPTAESPGYVAESDPEEDPEYEDDEEQDGLVDYPMGEGDDGGDDDDDSSGDDADDEDE